MTATNDENFGAIFKLQATMRSTFFLDENALARRGGVSVCTLQNQRVAGVGIAFLKLGCSVRYRFLGIVEHKNAALRNSTSEGSSYVVFNERTA